MKLGVQLGYWGLLMNRDQQLSATRLAEELRSYRLYRHDPRSNCRSDDMRRPPNEMSSGDGHVTRAGPVDGSRVGGSARGRR